MSILDPEPNEPTEPTVTDEGLEAAFKAKFETPPDEPTVTDEPTEPVEPTEPTKPVTDPVEPSEPTEPTSDSYEIAPGVSLSRDQIAAYYRFEQELQTNQAFRDYLSRFPQA